MQEKKYGHSECVELGPIDYVKLAEVMRSKEED